MSCYTQAECESQAGGAAGHRLAQFVYYSRERAVAPAPRCRAELGVGQSAQKMLFSEASNHDGGHGAFVLRYVQHRNP